MSGLCVLFVPPLAQLFQWPEDARCGCGEESQPGAPWALGHEGLVGRLPTLAQTSHVLV